ncbi:MAG TPA: extensin family protein, partial [Rhodospirillales bacterium]|nr:extensin family protein [Rhodospirillales bacterium]
AIVAFDRLPPQHSPFATLDPQRPIGWATARQLARLKTDPAACRAALDRARLRTTPIADSREGEFCGFSNAVAIERSDIPWSQTPLRLSCPMAVAIAVWERQVVAPAAERYLGARVTRIDHLGTYACRRVVGSPSGRPSQHATANAIDIAAFRLADGRRVALAGGWGEQTLEAGFLQAVRDGSCRLFRGVLRPEYNAAHADHFHLDMGPYRICQ